MQAVQPGEANPSIDGLPRASGQTPVANDGRSTAKAAGVQPFVRSRIQAWHPALSRRHLLPHQANQRFAPEGCSSFKDVTARTRRFVRQCLGRHHRIRSGFLPLEETLGVRTEAPRRVGCFDESPHQIGVTILGVAAALLIATRKTGTVYTARAGGKVPTSAKRAISSISNMITSANTSPTPGMLYFYLTRGNAGYIVCNRDRPVRGSQPWRCRGATDRGARASGQPANPLSVTAAAPATAKVPWR
jgi:hypothetical protein